MATTKETEMTMTTAARHALHVALLRHMEASGETLPLDGWQHYSTSIAEDGVGRFSYDRIDGGADCRSLVVFSDSEHGPQIDYGRSYLQRP
jgi:hypothetical protein